MNTLNYRSFSRAEGTGVAFSNDFDPESIQDFIAQVFANTQNWASQREQADYTKAIYEATISLFQKNNWAVTEANIEGRKTDILNYFYATKAAESTQKAIPKEKKTYSFWEKWQYTIITTSAMIGLFILALLISIKDEKDEL